MLRSLCLSLFVAYVALPALRAQQTGSAASDEDSARFQSIVKGPDFFRKSLRDQKAALLQADFFSGASQETLEQVLLSVRRLLLPGFQEAVSSLAEKDYPNALKRLRPFADSGDVFAQMYVGEIYGYGLGVQAENTEALKWYRLAAENGAVSAQLKLGLWYYFGPAPSGNREYRPLPGVPQDAGQAVKWLRLGADNGVPLAQFFLGDCYQRGFGLRKDTSEAFKWYRRAANQGEPVAQYSLAEMYRVGEGTGQDYPQAAEWYRKAAEGTDGGFQVALSALQLGHLYSSGSGVSKDYAEAARWFLKALEWGDTNNPSRDVESQILDSEVGLGGLYFSGGFGVVRDYAEAARWLMKAAQRGDATGQAMLGLAYMGGVGLPKDLVLAHMWLNLAAAQGKSDAAQNRRGLENSMTREQIAKAEEMARNWQPTAAAGGSSAGGPSNTTAASPQIEATGTGFFVSGQGFILTNYHVIEGCSTVKTTVNGSQSLNVVAHDEANDLALLKSAQSPSQFATFSGSSAVRVGQSVMAVGYPLRGLLSSGANVTTGNVSALAGPHDDTGLLQITAPVQPGNSGGPLLDQSGNVIGVVVAKLDALKIARVTGDIPQNVNFAIKGTVVRTFLEANGVEIATAPSNLKLDPAAVAERAAKFTQVVECWK